jgi:hypothetical protein
MCASISVPAEAGLSVYIAEWALELQPVADSEETLVAWMANCGKWRRELQSRIGRLVRLEWIDPDGAGSGMRQGPNERRVLLYERAG